jgi:hypothetical protein
VSVIRAWCALISTRSKYDQPPPSLPFPFALPFPPPWPFAVATAWFPGRHDTGGATVAMQRCCARSDASASE